MQTYRIQATEHRNAYEALQHLDASGDDYAILVGGKYLTVSAAEAERLETAGIEFAYLSYNEAAERIMTIPVGC